MRRLWVEPWQPIRRICRLLAVIRTDVAGLLAHATDGHCRVRVQVTGGLEPLKNEINRQSDGRAAGRCEALQGSRRESGQRPRRDVQERRLVVTKTVAGPNFPLIQGMCAASRAS